MNDQRRKELRHALALLEDAKTIVENMKEEEDTAYNNLPDSLQEAESGTKLQENTEEMEEAVTSLEDVVEKLTNIIS